VLRRSVKLKPDRRLLDRPEYQEAHDRGEVFVAAVMHSFLAMWTHRIEGLGTFQGETTTSTWSSRKAPRQPTTS